MKLSIDDLVFLKSELNNTRIMNEEDLVYIKASHPQLYFATQLKKDEGVSLFPNNSWVYTLENKNLNEFILILDLLNLNFRKVKLNKRKKCKCN